MFPGYDALAKGHSAAADGRQDIFMDPPGIIDGITEISCVSYMHIPG